MLITLLVLAPFGLLLAVLSLPASCRSRVNAAGGPSVSPVRPEPAGGTAVPVITDAGGRDERRPFEADNGLIIGEAVRS
jgi:hypothetical protein